MAQADAERLKQVLDNLLSNAIKYTPERGQITLVLRVEGEQAVLQVSDTGRGIPKAALPQLFTKYHRVPGEATRGILGTGLGLLIVKEIVEAHGGSVQVASDGVPGSGSVFTIRIPLRYDPAAIQPTAEARDEVLRQMSRMIRSCASSFGRKPAAPVRLAGRAQRTAPPRRRPGAARHGAPRQPYAQR